MVYVIGAVVVTVVVVVAGEVSVTAVSALEVVVVTEVFAVVVTFVSSLFLGIFIASSVFYRLTIIYFLYGFDVAAEVKSKPIPVAP